MDTSSVDSLSEGYRSFMRLVERDIFDTALDSIFWGEFAKAAAAAETLRTVYRLPVRAWQLRALARLARYIPPVRVAAWCPRWLVRLIAPRRGRALLECKDTGLRERMRSIVTESREKGKRVGILGATNRAQMLFAYTSLAEARIAGIFEHETDRRGEIHGFGVSGTQELESARLDYLVIATPIVPPELQQRLEQLKGQGVDMIQVPAELAPSDRESAHPVHGPDQDNGRQAWETLPRLGELPPLGGAPLRGEVPLVAVLARRAEGARPLARFAESYRAAPETMPHELVVLFKGFGGERDKQAHRRALAGLRYRELDVLDEGYDIGAFIGCFRQLWYPEYLFLGSFAVLLAPGWLSKMRAALSTAPRAGVVATSGSWERSRQRAYPNHHVRTSAFLIRRDVLASVRHGPIVTKEDAYSFEHGPASLTRQVLAMGLEPYVVGRDGVAFPKEAWARGGTFYSRRLENLLIGDNQTGLCRDLDDQTRAKIARKIWGDSFEEAIPV